jgi:hypothetical protein
MINEKCDACGKTFSLNDIFIIENNKLCANCAEEFRKTHKDIPVKEFKRQQDRTVCVNCHKDNGINEFSLMAGRPVCEECAAFFRNRPYPAWIKMAMAGLAAIVIISFAWNWRFIQAYHDIKLTNYVTDANQASKLFHSAAQRVPEAKGVSTMATYFDGIQLLKDDKSAEALKLFIYCKENLPSVPFLDEAIVNAEIGVAFDNKDYDKFITLAKQSSEKHPNEPYGMAQIASAYSCKYAVTADEQFKQLSLDFLKKAKTLAEQKEDLKNLEEYEDRILYRLETREIINKKAFNDKFPNGWKSQQKEQNK